MTGRGIAILASISNGLNAEDQIVNGPVLTPSPSKALERRTTENRRKSYKTMHAGIFCLFLDRSKIPD
jgi:hypothetical protein